MKRTSSWAVGAAVLFLLWSSNALGQELATLKVTVNDQTGAVIPGASVTLRNTQTGARRSDVSESHGLSVIPGVPAGGYELTVEAKGFTSRKLPVSLSVGQTASVVVTLGVTITQEVQVQDVVQGIDTEKSDISQVIDTPKINDLPVSGRDFIDFVLLTPSVNVGRSTAVGAQSPFTETVLKLSFAGVRESHTSFFALDGIDYTTSISGVQRISPSQDWVQEFRVVDSAYTADTGRNLGSVVNTVTKSGTNDVHGSVYEFFRNNNLDANNLLSAPGFNTLRFNQFGGTVGGPIRKEKNFYFLGYEGQRRAESPIYSSLILHCTDTPGCFGPGSPSINQVKQDLGLQPESLNSILTIDDYDKFIGKTNNILTDKTFLNITYLFNDSRKKNARGAAPGEGLPSSYRDNPVRDQTLYSNLIHVFNHDLTSETLLQYGRRSFELNPKGLGFEPALGIPDLLSSGGFVGSVRFYQEQHFQFGENLTYTRGNHALKFGGEVQPIWTTTQVPLFSPGFAIFAPQTFFLPPPNDGTPVAFLFLEPRSLFGTQIPNRDPNFEAGLYAGPSEQTFNDATTVDYRHTLWSLYAQDQWKARPNLTFTLGLRYDVDKLPPGSELKQIGGFHPTQYGNVQPRAGFAYAFNGGRGVLRGGFGLFTGPFVYSDILVSWVGASEFTPFTQPFLPEFSNPSQNLIGFGPSGAVGDAPISLRSDFINFVTTGAYPPPTQLAQVPLGYAKKDFPLPFSEQGNLELEHQIGKDFFVSLGYQWLHASRLPVYSSINGAPQPGCDPLVTSGCKQFFAPLPEPFGFVLYVKPIGFSIYNAGTLSVRKAFSHNFSLLANYTYAKSIDIATTVNLPNTPENYLHPEYDRAVGDNDVRHRFTLAFQAESPKEWPRLLRDFKFSTLTSLQSARYFSINSGFDTNGDLFPFPDRVGTSSRNIYKGDPYYDVDVRLQRDIPFTERIKGEASVEAFNLFNRPNVEDVDHVYGAPDFIGAVPKQFGDHISSPGNPTFGSPKFASPARQLQLSFRVTF
ncbi:MAG: TonB-dependent receptor [Acidobacteriia bacterium]|nr:TonB-dependent receptor [Terriglobia bacterium]